MFHGIAAQFSERVRSLTEADLEAPMLPASLLMKQTGDYSCFYAPFDHVNRTARVVVVGITPGLHQARVALRTMRDVLIKGQGMDAALERAKVTASFSGPMRSNLVEMLDAFRLHTWLQIDSCARLFADAAHLIHYTSALRYPVFRKGSNYSGSSSMHCTPLLAWMMDEFLASELSTFADAIIVPLGPAAHAAVEYVRSRGVRLNVLRGPQHPSTANNERVYYLLGKKTREALSAKVDPHRIDAERAAGMQLMEQLLAVT